MNIHVDFDPLEAEIEVLDNAFYAWLHSQDDESVYEWIQIWREAEHEPVVYTADEIYEGWGSDIEDFVETNNLVVDKALTEEIQRKRKIINEINEECPYCLDGTCTSLEHGD